MVIIVLNSFLKLIKNDFKAEELKKKTERNSYKLNWGRDFAWLIAKNLGLAHGVVSPLNAILVPSIMSRELRDLKTILSGYWIRANTQMLKTCSH